MHQISRVGLVGYGMAGREFHAPLLREADMTPAIVSTSDPQRGAAAYVDNPGCVVVNDMAELLAAAPDLVIIASPTGFHADHVRAAISEGIPVVCDKPLGVNAQQVREVIDMAQRRDTPLTVFHNRRWDPEQLTLASVLESGQLGKVHRFERRWERWRPEPRERWKETASPEEGGGLLLDLGSHLVDSAVQLFGPVASVFAQLRSLTTTPEDDVFLVLQHDGGVQSVLWASSLSGAPGPRTRVLGDAGAYLVGPYEDEPTAFPELVNKDPDQLGWLYHGADREPVARAAGGHDDFYPAVRSWLAGEGPIPVDPLDALHTAEVLDAARRSAASGEVVRL